MGVFDRFREAPPSASGRSSHDILLGLADVAVTGLWALSGSISRVTAPAPYDSSITLTVVERTVVAHDQDVVTLTFAGADGAPLPRWRPGAHLDIHLPSGRVRQYSLCGDPARPDGYRIAVRRIPDGGGGSVEVHESSALAVRSPRTGRATPFR
jgi:hypothetical protein